MCSPCVAPTCLSRRRQANWTNSKEQIQRASDSSTILFADHRSLKHKLVSCVTASVCSPTALREVLRTSTGRTKPCVWPFASLQHPFNAFSIKFSSLTTFVDKSHKTSHTSQPTPRSHRPPPRSSPDSAACDPQDPPLCGQKVSPRGWRDLVSWAVVAGQLQRCHGGISLAHHTHTAHRARSVPFDGSARSSPLL